MRALLQRVREASVEVDKQVVAQIGPGLAILLGVGLEDNEEKAAALARKIAYLRVFEDEEGKMNLSIQEVGGEVLVVSQFTLYADTRKGNRPSFTQAAPPEVARPLVEVFARYLGSYGIPVQQGVFGAHMLVHILNDGPVTIWLEQ
ncbi:D-aminoacyl-tRNA deacylase [uncultured Thermanaerothrix sp.]|uniref:D-aminoacyl-tRNA deacylase n=1 Tax=uncultured Thermanaerothrix sp. TaxID=1195149 RepID=UPI00260B8193|nr:D-aminoacyl-tRNA deacylase [uncultured Thermanaerothrix sp.]